jgi:hypothetical protein
VSWIDPPWVHGTQVISNATDRAEMAHRKTTVVRRAADVPDANSWISLLKILLKRALHSFTGNGGIAGQLLAVFLSGMN